MLRRVIIIILDACGVGELPDADRYGDRGAATVPNVARELGGLSMPNCRKLGLGNITAISGVEPSERPAALWGKMAEQSAGKDSTSGHWEIGGIILKKAFPVYPNGFPAGLVAEFEKRAGVRTVGNVPASGTEIIKQLGGRHVQTGEIILYTSADSVFQLAAHEDVFPPEKLYEICRIAREFLQGEHGVGRVIARPFVCEKGSFTRTVNRRDFSMEPPDDTILDRLHKESIPTVAIGKISDLYAGRGISRAVKAKNNAEVMDKVIDEMDKTDYGLIFANLVDFDMLWGHRNDTASFGKGLEYFDRRLPEVLNRLNNNDLLIITADHGCDPTIKHSTDHTREYVPLLVYSITMTAADSLGTRKTFSDIARTLAEIYGIDYTFPGDSFFKNILHASG
ncbi:MAG: phosphopentomutase [Candidatus Zixiibacteriota bacterium]|nr:MAG: phosphopentomutase [candidate division Zixibacteria bacterium]